jgi:uncharacterized protein (TIGR02001 family)
MKKLTAFALACVLAATFAAPVLAAGPLDVRAELPVYSKYVWRGMVQTDDPVLQPSVDLGLFGFQLGFWGNLDMTDVNSSDFADTEWKFTEIDWMLGYKLGLPLVELGAGFLWYTYPEDTGAETVEFYVGAKANVILSPSLTVYQDLDAFKGAYWDATIGHDVGVGESGTLQLTAGLGLGSKSYMTGFFGVPVDLTDPATVAEIGASAADARIAAAYPVGFTPFFTFTPSVAWSTLLSDAKKAVDDNEGLYAGKTNAFVFGLAAEFTF